MPPHEALPGFVEGVPPHELQDFVEAVHSSEYGLNLNVCNLAQTPTALVTNRRDNPSPTSLPTSYATYYSAMCCPKIRMGRDSNPGFRLRNTRFPSVRNRPLCHPSNAVVT